MTNEQAITRFEGYTKGAVIEQLFWIAGMWENRDLKDFLKDTLPDTEIEKLFPEIFADDYYKEYSLLEHFVTYQKFGFLAVVNYPECRGFRFKEGKPVSWSVSSSISRIGYVYGETREDLLNAIEKQSDEIFQEYLKKETGLKKVK